MNSKVLTRSDRSAPRRGQRMGRWLLVANLAAAVVLALLHSPRQAVGFQTFYVDFDSIADAFALDPMMEGLPPADEIYEYSTTQRTFILEYLNSNYSPYDMIFLEGTKPAPGAGSNITLNGGFGAGAEQVDFRNLDKGDDAKVNIISIFKFLGKDAMTDPWTDDDVMIATAKAAAHEAEHLLGGRHHDKSSPLNMGLAAPGAGLDPGDFSPSYPGPTDAFESAFTFSSLHAGGSLSFASLTSAPDTTFVSERIIPRLVVAADSPEDPGDPFLTIDEGDNHSLGMAQPITSVTGFARPYPLRPTDTGLTLIEGKAAVVLGELEMIGMGVPGDYYEFFGEAGEKWTIEAMSYLLPDPDGDGKRYADNADVAFIVLAGPGAPLPFATGSVIPYYGDPFGAMNDDDDDKTDGDVDLRGATVLDLELPYTGSYIIEVIPAASFLGTGKPGPTEPKDFGSYELFLYSAKATPEPTTFMVVGMGMMAGLMQRRRRRGQLAAPLSEPRP